MDSLRPKPRARRNPRRQRPLLARQLVELTGGGDLGKQMLEQMVDAFRASDPSIPDAFWDEFVASVDASELVEMAIPIYVKHLTSEEMAATIAFYSSPEGQAVLRKLPLILSESMAAGQQWGEALGRRVAERLAARENTKSSG